jgi:hypothetical protein
MHFTIAANECIYDLIQAPEVYANDHYHTASVDFFAVRLFLSPQILIILYHIRT